MEVSASSAAAFERERPRLRPRLVHPRELAGPRRAMCRREAFGGLLRAIALGPEPGAPLLTTALLDRWPVDFDEAFEIALMNFRRRVGPEHVADVEGAGGVRALLASPEQAAAGALSLSHLIPRGEPGAGVLFSVPHEDVLLLIPVRAGGGAEVLASIVQATVELSAAHGEPLSDQVFWGRGERIDHLPMTLVQERRGQRVHLDAQGPSAELLRLLGAMS